MSIPRDQQVRETPRGVVVLGDDQGFGTAILTVSEQAHEEVPRLLSWDECRYLLDYGSGVGHLAWVEDGKPRIIALPYKIAEEDVLVQVGSDGVELAPEHTSVVFEIDENRSTHDLGWSVLVNGTIASLPARDWSSRIQWMSISMELMTGRFGPQK